MASMSVFDSFVEKLAEKVFNLGSDNLKLALSNSEPNSAQSILSDISEISYTHCSSRSVTVNSSSQSAGIYKLIIADLTMEASGGTVGPFQYIILYDDTATQDDLIGWWDIGSVITMADTETFDINFDDAQGAIKIQVA